MTGRGPSSVPPNIAAEWDNPDDARYDEVPGRVSSSRTEYAVRHPTGHVDEMDTATQFGATEDPLLAMRLLDVAQSDCLCSDGGTHSLVTRTVTVEITPWITA